MEKRTEVKIFCKICTSPSNADSGFPNLHICTTADTDLEQMGYLPADINYYTGFITSEEESTLYLSKNIYIKNKKNNDEYKNIIYICDLIKYDPSNNNPNPGMFNIIHAPCAEIDNPIEFCYKITNVYGNKLNSNQKISLTVDDLDNLEYYLINVGGNNDNIADVVDNIINNNTELNKCTDRVKAFCASPMTVPKDVIPQPIIGMTTVEPSYNQIRNSLLDIIQLLYFVLHLSAEHSTENAGF